MIPRNQLRSQSLTLHTQKSPTLSVQVTNGPQAHSHPRCVASEEVYIAVEDNAMDLESREEEEHIIVEEEEDEHAIREEEEEEEDAEPQ